MLLLVVSLGFSIYIASGFHGGSVVKNLPANAGDMSLTPLGQEDPKEKEMETHCSIHTWKIPWIEESSELQPTGLQKHQTKLSD